MIKPKPSKIQLNNINLKSLVFEKLSSKVRSKISFKIISIDAHVQQLSEIECITTCKIEINSKRDKRSYFYLSAEYEVFSMVTDKVGLNDLIAFSKIGAPFNVLVHAREVIHSITLNAFGKAATLPLLNITDFGKVINITTDLISEQNDNIISSPTSPISD